MRRRRFLQTVGASTVGVAAFSCADRKEASRINGGSLADADLEWK